MLYSTKQVKDSGIFPIFVGGGLGGGRKCVIIFGKFGGGVRANFPLLRGEVLCNMSPCESPFPPPPLLIIIAQSLKSTFVPTHFASTFVLWRALMRNS